MSETSFLQTDIPPHHFYLGGDKYIAVSDFSDMIRIDIRKFWRSDYRCLIPTRMGVTLSLAQWQSLTNKMDLLSVESESCEIIFMDDLTLSTVYIQNTLHVALQRYFQRSEFIPVFLPSRCILSEPEWKTLKNIHKRVTYEIIKVLFGRIFQKMILKKVDEQTSANVMDKKNSDAEMILTTSMIELLKNHLQININKLFKCCACEIGYRDRQGHECANYNHQLDYYGDQAILQMNLEQLAAEFIKQNIHIINYIKKDFLCKLDMFCLLLKAKELYVSSDPTPLFIL